MSTAKINIKSIDYFKFRKLVIDGNRDDYGSCSREVKALCDAVQTLSFRDDEFDGSGDRTRLADISSYYRQILSGKRVDPVDMRLKSGWWGDPNRTVTGYSAGKIKQTALLEVLSAKSRDWYARHRGVDSGAAGATAAIEPVEDKIEGPGLYVFKHRERQCFQQVSVACGQETVFSRCAERLKAAFDGSASAANDPIAALLVVTLASDWDFYFVPVATTDGERVLRILENDLVLKHDTIWPHGLNGVLHIETPVEVAEFRRSCLRHRWPPEYDTAARPDPVLDLERLRRQIASASASDLTPWDQTRPSASSSAASTAGKGSTASATDDSNLQQDCSTTANVDHPATPSKKAATARNSSGTGASGPATAAAAGGGRSTGSAEPSSHLAPTKSSNATTSKTNSSQRAVSKETGSAGASGTSATSGKAPSNSTAPTKASPTKQPTGKLIGPATNANSNGVQPQQTSPTTAATATPDSTSATHHAGANESDPQQQPIKRSGTFTSIPSAVDAENGSTVSGIPAI